MPALQWTMATFPSADNHWFISSQHGSISSNGGALWSSKPYLTTEKKYWNYFFGKSLKHSLKLLILFMPLVFLNTPWKHQKIRSLFSDVFKGYKNEPFPWNGLTFPALKRICTTIKVESKKFVTPICDDSKNIVEAWPFTA